MLEIAGWMLLFVLWYLTLHSFSNLPSTIPTHFDFAGKADDFGSKATIFLLPIIGTVLFVGLTVLNRFPHIFNFPTKITEENALRQYTLATKMLRFLKTAILLIFSFIVHKIYSAASGKSDGMGYWFMPLLLGLIFVPIIYYIIKMFKAK